VGSLTSPVPLDPVSETKPPELTPEVSLKLFVTVLQCYIGNVTPLPYNCLGSKVLTPGYCETEDGPNLTYELTKG